MTVLNCGLIRMMGGVKGLVDESMEEEGCRGKVIREIVEIKESEGEGGGRGRDRERDVQAGRKGERKCLVCLKERR